MHNEEWSGTRVAQVLARLSDEGYPQTKLARLAGVNRSQVNKWSRGEHRPGYDPARKLALAIWRQHPAEARELVEASGYHWADPADADLPPPERLSEETRAAIRRDLAGDPVLAEQVIAYTEGLASGAIPPAPSSPASDPQAGGSERRRARG